MDLREVDPAKDADRSYRDDRADSRDRDVSRSSEKQGRFALDRFRSGGSSSREGIGKRGSVRVSRDLLGARS